MTELGIATLVRNHCHEIYFPRLEQCKCVYQPTHFIQVPRNSPLYSYWLLLNVQMVETRYNCHTWWGSHFKLTVNNKFPQNTVNTAHYLHDTVIPRQKQHKCCCTLRNKIKST